MSTETSQVEGEQERQGKGYRTFPYAMIRGHQGRLLWDDEITQEIRKGDFDGWYELVDVVRGNCERARRSEPTARVDGSIVMHE